MRYEIIIISMLLIEIVFKLEYSFKDCFSGDSIFFKKNCSASKKKLLLQVCRAKKILEIEQKSSKPHTESNTDNFLFYTFWLCKKVQSSYVN